MNISFAVTTHNEGEYIDRLLSQLATYIEDDDECEHEIVILDDYSTDDDTIGILEPYAQMPFVSFYQRELDRDFGAHKTHLNSLCSGDYIFQIDADELPADILLDFLPLILDENKVDLIYVPRVNTVVGLTQNHIDQWGWHVNQDGWILWPDYQTRIYKNSPNIVWEGAVHERISGFETYTHLPANPMFALKHQKDIQRQEEQNQFYSEILRGNSNDF